MEGTPLRTDFRSALVATVVNVKTSGGRIAGIEASNPNTVSEWLQLFDALAANVTLGTTTPKISLAIPKGASASDVGIMDKLWGEGIGFELGISIAATTTPTGATAPGTGLTVNTFYL